MGFIKNTSDQCIYKKSYGSNFVIFVLYVDDIILANNSMKYLNKTKHILSCHFDIKDLVMPLLFLAFKSIMIGPVAFMVCLKQPILSEYLKGSIWTLVLLVLHMFKRVKSCPNYNVLKIMLKGLKWIRFYMLLSLTTSCILKYEPIQK